MEETMSMIFHGFKLVHELESSLPEKSPETLTTSLDDIAKTFGDANDRLKILLRNSETALNQSKPVFVSDSNLMLMHIEPELMQEYWLRYGGSTSSQGTEAVVQTQLMAVDGDKGRNLTAAEGSTTPIRQRTSIYRKDEGEEQTVLVAALRTGNTDMPPDDNHTWRKYGQKEILGSRFPRAYYRCTHQKLYNCPAKKQVQRLNDDPFTFRVTYRGSHTCNTYLTTSTAPSSSSVTVATTMGHSVGYSPAVLDMTDAMFGSNMDFIFPFDDHQRFRRFDDGDGDK